MEGGREKEDTISFAQGRSFLSKLCFFQGRSFISARASPAGRVRVRSVVPVFAGTRVPSTSTQRL